MRFELVCLAFTLIFIGCAIGSEPDTSNAVWKDGIGILTNSSGSYNMFYTVNGKQYETYIPKHYGCVIPEYYKLRFDSLNPSTVEVCQSCQVFLPDEKTQMLPGEIKKITNAYGKAGWIFIFKYEVYGIVFKKSQSLPANFKVLYPNLKAGQRYEVECLEKGVQRSVLHLDRPAKDDLYYPVPNY